MYLQHLAVQVQVHRIHSRAESSASGPSQLPLCLEGGTDEGRLDGSATGLPQAGEVSSWHMQPRCAWQIPQQLQQQLHIAEHAQVGSAQENGIASRGSDCRVWRFATWHCLRTALIVLPAGPPCGQFALFHWLCKIEECASERWCVWKTTRSLVASLCLEQGQQHGRCYH